MDRGSEDREGLMDRGRGREMDGWMDRCMEEGMDRWTK